MSQTANHPPLQFRLKSLLMGVVWLAFLLGICVQYQRASMKQRQAVDRLKAAGFWHAAPPGGRTITYYNRGLPAESNRNASP